MWNIAFLIVFVGSRMKLHYNFDIKYILSTKKLKVYQRDRLHILRSEYEHYWNLVHRAASRHNNKPLSDVAEQFQNCHAVRSRTS